MSFWRARYHHGGGGRGEGFGEDTTTTASAAGGAAAAGEQQQHERPSVSATTRSLNQRVRSIAPVSIEVRHPSSTTDLLSPASSLTAPSPSQKISETAGQRWRRPSRSAANASGASASTPTSAATTPAAMQTRSISFEQQDDDMDQILSPSEDDDSFDTALFLEQSMSAMSEFGPGGGTIRYVDSDAMNALRESQSVDSIIRRVEEEIAAARQAAASAKSLVSASSASSPLHAALAATEQQRRSKQAPAPPSSLSNTREDREDKEAGDDQNAGCDLQEGNNDEEQDYDSEPSVDMADILSTSTPDQEGVNVDVLSGDVLPDVPVCMDPKRPLASVHQPQPSSTTDSHGAPLESQPENEEQREDENQNDESGPTAHDPPPPPPAGNPHKTENDPNFQSAMDELGQEFGGSGGGGGEDFEPSFDFSDRGEDGEPVPPATAGDNAKDSGNVTATLSTSATLAAVVTPEKEEKQETRDVGEEKEQSIDENPLTGHETTSVKLPSETPVDAKDAAPLSDESKAQASMAAKGNTKSQPEELPRLKIREALDKVQLLTGNDEDSSEEDLHAESTDERTVSDNGSISEGSGVPELENMTEEELAKAAAAAKNASAALPSENLPVERATSGNHSQSTANQEPANGGDAETSRAPPAEEIRTVVSSPRSIASPHFQTSMDEDNDEAMAIEVELEDMNDHMSCGEESSADGSCESIAEDESTTDEQVSDEAELEVMKENEATGREKVSHESTDELPASDNMAAAPSEVGEAVEIDQQPEHTINTEHNNDDQAFLTPRQTAPQDSGQKDEPKPNSKETLVGDSSAATRKLSSTGKVDTDPPTKQESWEPIAASAESTTTEKTTAESEIESAPNLENSNDRSEDETKRLTHQKSRPETFTFEGMDQVEHDPAVSDATDISEIDESQSQSNDSAQDRGPTSKEGSTPSTPVNSVGGFANAILSLFGGTPKSTNGVSPSPSLQGKQQNIEPIASAGSLENWASEDAAEEEAKKNDDHAGKGSVLPVDVLPKPNTTPEKAVTSSDDPKSEDTDIKGYVESLELAQPLAASAHTLVNEQTAVAPTMTNTGLVVLALPDLKQASQGEADSGALSPVSAGSDRSGLDSKGARSKSSNARRARAILDLLQPKLEQSTAENAIAESSDPSTQSKSDDLQRNEVILPPADGKQLGKIGRAKAILDLKFQSKTGSMPMELSSDADPQGLQTPLTTAAFLDSSETKENVVAGSDASISPTSDRGKVLSGDTTSGTVVGERAKAMLERLRAKDAARLSLSPPSSPRGLEALSLRDPTSPIANAEGSTPSSPRGLSALERRSPSSPNSSSGGNESKEMEAVRLATSPRSLGAMEKPRSAGASSAALSRVGVDKKTPISPLGSTESRARSLLERLRSKTSPPSSPRGLGALERRGPMSPRTNAGSLDDKTPSKIDDSAGIVSVSSFAGGRTKAMLSRFKQKVNSQAESTLVGKAELSSEDVLAQPAGIGGRSIAVPDRYKQKMSPQGRSSVSSAGPSEGETTGGTNNVGERARAILEFLQDDKNAHTVPNPASIDGSDLQGGMSMVSPAGERARAILGTLKERHEVSSTAKKATTPQLNDGEVAINREKSLLEPIDSKEAKAHAKTKSEDDALDEKKQDDDTTSKTSGRPDPPSTPSTKAPDAPPKSGKGERRSSKRDRRVAQIEDSLNRKSRRIRFRDPFPIIKPPTRPRDADEIISRHLVDVPSFPMRWVRPKSDLRQLIVAAMGASLPRRSNACGALKVLTRQKKNQLTLVRTDGFLEAIAFAASQDITDHDMDLAIDARTRAMACLRNVCEPKDNRINVLMHPGNRECILKVIREDTGEARVLACGALALLAKTPECRVKMVEIDGLIELLSQVMSGSVDAPVPEAEVENTETIEDIGGVVVSEMSQTDDEASQSSSTQGGETLSQSSTKESGSFDEHGGGSYDDDHSGDESHTDSDYSTGSSGTDSSYDSEGSSQDNSKHNRGPRKPSYSIRMQNEEMQAEFLQQARSNACAVLLHLSKQCAISHKLCLNTCLMDSLIMVAKELERPIHTKCLEIVSNLSRFPPNVELLVHYEGLVDGLVDAAESVLPSDRTLALWALQNMAADAASKTLLASDSLLTCMISCALRRAPEEKEAAVAVLYNISTEPGAVVSMTNTKNVVATLVHLAHHPESPSNIRLMACDALATISLWLQTLAGTGRVPKDILNVPLPSQRTTGWERWE